MPTCCPLALLVLISAPVVAHAAPDRGALLPISTEWSTLAGSELELVEDGLQSDAGEALTQAGVQVLDAARVGEALRTAKFRVDECEVACLTKLGKALSARWLVASAVVSGGRGHVLTVRVVDANTGAAAASASFEGKDANVLESAVHAGAKALFARAGIGGAAPVAEPPKATACPDGKCGVAVVLPPDLGESKLTDADRTALLEAIRSRTVALLRPRGFVVPADSEELFALIPDPEQASSPNCELEAARAFGAKVFVGGFVFKVDRTTFLALRLYETRRGRAISSLVVEGAKTADLLRAFESKADAFLEPATRLPDGDEAPRLVAVMPSNEVAKVPEAIRVGVEEALRVAAGDVLAPGAAVLTTANTLDLLRDAGVDVMAAVGETAPIAVARAMKVAAYLQATTAPKAGGFVTTIAVTDVASGQVVDTVKVEAKSAAELVRAIGPGARGLLDRLKAR